MSLIKDGIKNRLDGDISNIKYAHIIWDTLAEGFESFDQRMTTKEQLQEFDNIESQLQISNETKILPEEPIEEQKIAADFYDENDSDNDSDFEGFVIEEDDAKDIKFSTKPTHLYDLIKGLQSEDIERYHLALESANDIIRKNLPNLDVLLNELLQILFRTENKFSKDDFENLKSGAIRACLFVKPAESAGIFFTRLGYKEASLGHKIKLLGLMQDAFRELADSEYQQEKFEDKANSYNDYAEEFKNFFETPHFETDLDRNLQIVDKRIEENTSKKISYYVKQKEQKAKRNYLLAVSDKIIYPLLTLPQYSDTCLVYLDEKDLTVAYLRTVSLLLYHWMNSYNFKSYIEETWQTINLFMDIKDSGIRKWIIEIFTTIILGCKQFMIDDLLPYLKRVRMFEELIYIDWNLDQRRSTRWWRYKCHANCKEISKCVCITLLYSKYIIKLNLLMQNSILRYNS